MEWAPIITAIASILTPIGLGFAWLIREIVKTSKDAVAELKTERDLWRDRAYKAGWRPES